LQRVLVHRVDSRKVENAEVQQAGSEGHRAIALSGLIDFGLGYLGVFDSLVDLGCEFLARLQLVDQRLVHQNLINAALRLGKRSEDRVLDVQQFLLIGRVLFHDFSLFLLQVGVLDGDDLGQHLLLEAAGSDGEVDDGNLHKGFRGVVGIGQCGRHEELEGVVVGESLVSDLDYS